MTNLAQAGNRGVGFIQNFGDNNTISDSVVDVSSNNDNKIKQETKQINQNCSDSTFCLNTGFAKANIGSGASPNIVSVESDQNISQNTLNSNINNDNSISQVLTQDNFCGPTSDCENNGNVTTEVAGQNGQTIDQTLNQNNLCFKSSQCLNDGKVIGLSGSNSQSNICL